MIDGSHARITEKVMVAATVGDEHHPVKRLITHSQVIDSYVRLTFRQ